MSRGALLTREDILAVEDRPTRDVPVPEWGGVVRVRGLSGKERDEYEVALSGLRPDGRPGRPNLANVRARLLALTIVDAEGHPCFSLDDIEALGAKSAVALERVFDVARSLSGLSDDDVQELAENFAVAPNAPGTSD